MNLANCLDLVSAPWAITPEAHRTICAAVNRKLIDASANLESTAAGIRRPLVSTDSTPQLVGDVAVISIFATLARGKDWVMEMFGGTSTQDVRSQLKTAIANPNVRSILLRINSPGGAVDGTSEVAEAVFAARSLKPIVAFAEGIIASAAFWIGSAALKVFISEPTTAVGSIGCIATHIDRSGWDAQLGIKVTEVAAGKYKRVFSSHAPLTADGREAIQAVVDHHYSVFVDAVARNRGVSVDAVLERMADGRIFFGRQAVDAGLADGIKTFDQVIAELGAAGTGSRAITAAIAGNRGNSPETPVNPAATHRERNVDSYLRDADKVRALKAELSNLGVSISDGEAVLLATGDKSSPAAIALHARVYQARERAAGRAVSSVAAVDRVMKEVTNG